MPKSKRKWRSNSASGYIGVYLTKSKRYCAQIYINGKKQYLDTYDTAKQAAKAYDAAAIELGRPFSKLNFPKKVPPGYTPTNNGQRSDNTSGYRGVTNRGKYGYQAMISMNGKNTSLGYFNTRKQAAVAYDHAVHKHRLPTSWFRLNFPTMKHNLNKEPKGRKKQKVNSTGFRGVQESGKKFTAQISINGTTVGLGTFTTAKHAARAYDQAILKHNKSTISLNFPQQTTNDDIEIKEEPKDDEISSNSQWL